MPSDLTAAIEAAKRLGRIHAGERPLDVYGSDPTLSDPNNQYVIDMRLSLGRYLEWCSQPLYRRRKAEWVYHRKEIDGGWVCESWVLQNDRRYSIERITRNGSLIRFVQCIPNSSEAEVVTAIELAQAACEAHFWEQLERDAVERVN